MIPLLLLFATLSQSQSRPENIEWCDAWLPHMKESDLPRVMLIGDSITRGYYAGVEERLKGKAYVARITTSRAIGDPALLEELQVFLRQARFRVVHFNVGMHGWDYTEEEYARHLPSLLKTIRKWAPGATIVWAHTTPIRKDKPKGAQNARIEVRNRIAQQFFDRQKVPVNDLHSLMLPHPDLHSDDVHFNKDGNVLLSDAVAKALLPLLP